MTGAKLLRFGNGSLLFSVSKYGFMPVTVYNDFLSDGTLKTLYLASLASGMTSLLKPDSAALKFFNGFENFGKIYQTEQIQTRRLDDVAAIPAIDLLKMDIQGSELSVLQNGLNTLVTIQAIKLFKNNMLWICKKNAEFHNLLIIKELYLSCSFFSRL